ncbi:MAG: response regulator [Acidiferrobacterales bacterium]|nr:response regulator [Acidiferrobacterales bacterium]
MSAQQILIVEDEPKIALLLSDYLTSAGYQVTTLEEGTRAVETIKQAKPDCVILDVMLPGMSGLDICKEVRKFSMLPVVMITARVDEIDRLLGLELGADDYICKPFSPREVVVRIRNILRRVSLSQAQKTEDEGPGDTVEYRDLSLNLERFQCILGSESISLTAVEFRMLFAMASRPGCIFSRDQLMTSAYTDTRVVSDRTIDTHIKNLRKKISEAYSEDLIHSIYGVGYKVE